MREILRVINELKNHGGKLDKERIIRESIYSDNVDAVFRFLFDDLIVTGVKRAKLNKLLKLSYNGSEHADNITELLEYFKTNNTGKEVDVNYLIATAKHFKGMYGEEYGDLAMSIICKDVKTGCKSSTYNKANPSNPIYVHDVMAGKAWDEERARKLLNKGNWLYFTEKIDGNRGTRNHEGTAIVSRNGKDWFGVHRILNELNELVDNNFVPDGEFVYNDTTGEMTSQEVRAMTTSIMNDDKIIDKAEAGIVFKIFDTPLKKNYNSLNEGDSYLKRRKYMDSLEGIGDAKYVQVIPVEFVVRNENELKEVMPRLKAFIDSGKEGYMCIASNQPYKTGKGYQMMKLKNILSGDLKIVGWNYGKEKTKWEGKFASFNVELPYVDKDGKADKYTVSIGTGYDDMLRNKVNEDPDSYIGKVLEFLFTEVSKNKEGGYSLSYGRVVEVREDKNIIDLEKHSLVEINGEHYFQED